MLKELHTGFVDFVRTGKKKAVVASTSVVAAAAIVGCGDSDGGSDASTVPPTGTRNEQTVAPGTEVPTGTDIQGTVPAQTQESTPAPVTPEAPQANPMELVNTIISNLESLALPEGVNQNAWDSSKFKALEGLDDQGGNFGLYDIKTALEAGDTETADRMTSSELLLHLAGFVEANSENTVILRREDISRVDPQNLLIPSELNSMFMITYTQELALNLIKVKYALQPQ